MNQLVFSLDRMASSAMISILLQWGRSSRSQTAALVHGDLLRKELRQRYVLLHSVDQSEGSYACFRCLCSFILAFDFKKSTFVELGCLCQDMDRAIEKLDQSTVLGDRAFS